MSQPDPVARKDGARAPWSFRIATVSGIPIRLHFTFLLFLVWIALIGRTGAWLLFVLALFACIVLHELGHALTAQHYRIPTRDITLYPIGGVASLDGRPKPREELWIALAGPLVNVFIAGVLAVVLLYTRGGLPAFGLLAMDKTLLENLFVANVILPLFNMIPAFPMDGGRVLRAALALRIGERRATQIAGFIGQALAIALGLFGVLSQNVVLMIVAFFVYLGAGQEMSASISFSLLEGHRVAEAMVTRFRTIQSGATLEAASRMLLEGTQQDFPVVVGEEVIGLLPRSAIGAGIAEHGPGEYVSSMMKREFKRAQASEPLDHAIGQFSADAEPVLVFDGESLVGMLTSENVGEFIMLAHARTQRSNTVGA